MGCHISLVRDKLAKRYFQTNVIQTKDLNGFLYGLTETIRWCRTNIYFYNR